jgi:type I restriction enzyme M protein
VIIKDRDPQLLTIPPALIWSVADLLRGDYKQSEYGRVVLPLVVLRRLDCVLEPTKAKVLETAARLEGKVANVDPILCQVAGEQFYNTSPLDLRRLLDDPTRIADNLLAYIARFSPAARDVLDKFDFRTQVDRLAGRMCCTWSSPGSARSTCTPMWSATSRWATCTRS